MSRWVPKRVRQNQGAEVLFSVHIDLGTMLRLKRMAAEKGEEYEHILRAAVQLWDLVSHSSTPLKGYPVLEREARNRLYSEACSAGSVVDKVVAGIRRQKG